MDKAVLKDTLGKLLAVLEEGDMDGIEAFVNAAPWLTTETRDRFLDADQFIKDLDAGYFAAADIVKDVLAGLK